MRRRQQLGCSILTGLIEASSGGTKTRGDNLPGCYLRKSYKQRKQLEQRFYASACLECSKKRMTSIGRILRVKEEKYERNLKE